MRAGTRANTRQHRSYIVNTYSLSTPFARRSDPNNKALTLLQSYFERKPLGVDLKQDQDVVVEGAVKILQAIVDVVATNHWLKVRVCEERKTKRCEARLRGGVTSEATS